MLGITREQQTGLCSVLFKGGHFGLNSFLNDDRLNLFTAAFCGEKVTQVKICLGLISLSIVWAVLIMIPLGMIILTIF